MEALIIVDVQHDFLHGGALEVPGGDMVLPVISRLMKRFDFIVATQDWHPADHGSFASSHPGAKVRDVIDLHGQRQVLWPTHCVQNTHGAELAAEIDMSKVDRVIRKGQDPAIDSYSAFHDNGRRHDTGLAGFLRSNKVTRVVVVGLATDYCVKATVLDAIDEGFEVLVVRDGIRGVDAKPGDSERAIIEMARAGAKIVFERDVAFRGDDAVEIIAEGKFLQLAKHGKWEFATRRNASSVVAVVPVTEDGRLLLVEQNRAPVGVNVIEFPAGLVGDHQSEIGEAEEVAAQRELKEETGFEGTEWQLLARGPTTPGMSDEVMALYMASGLRRVSTVLGDGDEQITLHEIPLSGVLGWLESMARSGRMIDLKVYSGLFLAAATHPQLWRAIASR